MQRACCEAVGFEPDAIRSAASLSQALVERSAFVHCGCARLPFQATHTQQLNDSFSPDSGSRTTLEDKASSGAQKMVMPLFLACILARYKYLHAQPESPSRTLPSSTVSDYASARFR